MPVIGLIFPCSRKTRSSSAESKDEQEYSRHFEGEGSGWDDTRGGAHG